MQLPEVEQAQAGKQAQPQEVMGVVVLLADRGPAMADDLWCGMTVECLGWLVRGGGDGHMVGGVLPVVVRHVPANVPPWRLTRCSKYRSLRESPSRSTVTTTPFSWNGKMSLPASPRSKASCMASWFGQSQACVPRRWHAFTNASALTWAGRYLLSRNDGLWKSKISISSISSPDVPCGPCGGRRPETRPGRCRSRGRWHERGHRRSGCAHGRG